MSYTAEHKTCIRSHLSLLLLLITSNLLPVIHAKWIGWPSSFKSIGPKVSATLTNYGGRYDRMDPNQPSYGVKNGACGYGTLSKTSYPYWRACAIDPASLNGRPSPCGMCYRLTGKQGKQIIVTLTDSCPGCNKRFKSNLHFDCHFDTYKEIGWVAPDGGGFMKIQAEQVACKPPGGIHFIIMTYNGPFLWLRVVPWQAAGNGLIRGLTVDCPKAQEFSWAKKQQRMKNTWGSSFEVGNSPGGSHCRFIVTDTTGRTVTTEIFDLSKYKGKTYKSQTNFW